MLMKKIMTATTIGKTINGRRRDSKMGEKMAEETAQEIAHVTELIEEMRT